MKAKIRKILASWFYSGPERRGDNSPIWLTIYSDMTTNLMMFFMMMYAFSRLTAVERKNLSQSLTQEFSTVAQKQDMMDLSQSEIDATKAVEDMIDKEGIKKFANVEQKQKVIKITFSAPILFNSGTAELKEESQKILGDIARMFVDTPHTIIVEGHTDNIPIHTEKFSSNWDLSAARAFSVIKFFNSIGISMNRMSALAYGENRPMASNDTEEGRGQNRRIEIRILRI